MKWKERLTVFIAYSYIALFAYAAISKWVVFSQFVKQMNAQPIDDRWTPLLVWGLPVAELAAAAMLFFRRSRFIGMCLSLCLMLAFTAYIWLVISNHYEFVPCACGGIIRKLTWWQHLWFNLYFVLIGILGVILSWSEDMMRSTEAPATFQQTSINNL